MAASKSSSRRNPGWKKALNSIIIYEVDKALKAYRRSLSFQKTSVSIPSVLEKPTKLSSSNMSVTELMIVSEKMVSSHPNKAYPLFVQGAIALGDGAFARSHLLMKQKILQVAISKVGEAVKRAPSSVAYSFFLASVLHNLARFDGNYYKNTIQECERGLSIEDPQDPTQERRVDDIGILDRLFSEFVKENIRGLLETVNREINNEKISTDLKYEGIIGEEIENMREKKVDIDIDYGELEDGKIIYCLPWKAKNESDSPSQTTNCKDHKKIEADKQKQVMDYWKGSSIETKQALLKVDIGELEKHFDSFKNKSVMKALKEALDYAKKEKKWIQWFCYECGENFSDIESWRKHLPYEICRDLRLQPHYQARLPEIVAADEWSKLAGDWKLLQSVQRDKKIKDLSCSVYGMMKSLISQNCFATSHVEKVKSCARDFLQTQSRSLVGINDFGLECIFNLDIPQLNEILDFLEHLAVSSWKLSYAANVVSNIRQVLCVDERIALSSDLSTLFLDKRSFPEEHYTGTLVADLKDVGNAAISAVDDGFENIELHDTDGFLTWLYPHLTLEEHLGRLKKLRLNCEALARILLHSVESVCMTLEKSCKQKANTKLQQVELCKLDAKILAALSLKEKLLQKLELICCWDYQLLMVHPLKSFILAQVEERAKKYVAGTLLAENVAEKSQAVKREEAVDDDGKTRRMLTLKDLRALDGGAFDRKVENIRQATESENKFTDLPTRTVLEGFMTECRKDAAKKQKEEKKIVRKVKQDKSGNRRGPKGSS